MSDERDELMDLVAAVADGEPVDWESKASRARDGRERAVVQSLHVVAQIARAHRDLALDDRPESRETADPGSTTPPDRSLSSPRPTRWGHLEILEKVGEGGFGEVFRARDPRLDREVALKLRHATRSPRQGSDAATLEEGRLLARVRHPNVAMVHGAEENDGRVGIWMEFVRGKTLAQLLDDQGPFGAREAGHIGIELCRALTAVHGAGIVHRDVKAQNVMREEGGRIVLMDFGAGKELVREDESSASGTPLYMAPEILEGAAATVASDVYSVGVLLAHLVTGAFPVEARSVAELRERHRKGETRLLRELRSDLPEAFVQVVERALAPDPADRFPSTGRMERALAAALGAGPDDGDPVRRAPSIRRWAYVAAGVALLALVVAIVAPRWSGVVQAPLTSGRVIDTAGGVVAQGGDSLGADSRARVASLHDLAGLYEAMGAYERAAQIYGQALAVEEQALGPDDPLLGDSLTRLAWLHHVNGNEPDARVYYERAALVLDRQRVAPDAGADTALLDLGVLLGEAGRLADATKFLESVLEHRERTLGPDHPQVAAALDALAKLYVDAGDYSSAKPLLERSAAIGERSGEVSKASSFTSLESLGQRPAGPGLYDVEATLYRSGGPRGKERLGADSRVMPDDRLFLEFLSSTPLYVYVVNEDDRGEASLLFPLPGFDLVNPLPPDAVHRLPGRLLAGNRRVSWQVSSVGGREHFLVVASPERLLEFEDEIENLIVPRLDEPLVAVQLSEATTTRLRGIHRGIAQLAVEPEEELVAAQQTGSDAPVRLFQLARQLGTGPETVRGVWIRQIDLENPG